MRKFDFSVEDLGGRNRITFKLGAADVYDEKAKEKAEGTPGLSQFDYTDTDGIRTLTYLTTGTVTVEQFKKQTLNKRQVLAVLSGMAAAFGVGSKGVSVGYIVRDTNYIYIDPESLRVEFLLLPLKQEAISLSEIPAFFRDIIAGFRYADQDVDNYVARMLTITNSDDFSVEKLKSFADGELEKMGFFVGQGQGLENMNAGQPPQAGASVRVNKIGVMNNMRQMAPQGMPMGQPPMGAPMGMPPQGMAPQGMPMQQPPMGQPMMGQAPQMGRPAPMPGQLQMGQMPPQGMPMQQPPMGAPAPQPQSPMGQAPQGQPRMAPLGQPPMGGIAPQQLMGQPPVGMPPQGMPMQQPPQGQPQMGRPAPQPQPPMGGVAPMPGMPPMGQPQMGAPAPMPGMPPMGQPQMGAPAPQAPIIDPDKTINELNKPNNEGILADSSEVAQSRDGLSASEMQTRPAPEHLGSENNISPNILTSEGAPEKMPESLREAPEAPAEPEAPAPEVPVAETPAPEAPAEPEAPATETPVAEETPAEPTPEAVAPAPQPVPEAPAPANNEGILADSSEVAQYPQGTMSRDGLSASEMQTRPQFNVPPAMTQASPLVPILLRKKTGEEIPIVNQEFTVGKSEKADYMINGNTAVSRIHCVINKKNGVNYIRDNNSTNHTYINGAEIAPEEEVLLKNGTIIHMGDEEFTFYLRKGE